MNSELAKSAEAKWLFILVKNLRILKGKLNEEEPNERQINGGYHDKQPSTVNTKERALEGKDMSLDTFLNFRWRTPTWLWDRSGRCCTQLRGDLCSMGDSRPTKHQDATLRHKLGKCNNSFLFLKWFYALLPNAYERRQEPAVTRWVRQEEKVTLPEGGQALAQATQGGGGMSTLWAVWGSSGQCPKRPDLTLKLAFFGARGLNEIISIPAWIILIPRTRVWCSSLSHQGTELDYCPIQLDNSFVLISTFLYYLKNTNQIPFSNLA